MNQGFGYAGGFGYGGGFGSGGGFSYPMNQGFGYGYGANFNPMTQGFGNGFGTNFNPMAQGNGFGNGLNQGGKNPQGGNNPLIPTNAVPARSDDQPIPSTRSNASVKGSKTARSQHAKARTSRRSSEPKR